MNAQRFLLQKFFIRVLLVACALWIGISTARADGPVPASFFGMDDGGVLVKSDSNLALVKTMGANFVRLSLWWKYLEPTNTTPEHYNWSYTDFYLGNMADADIVPMLLVTENPAWATNTTCGPIDTTNPTMLAEFAEFLGAAAARYPQVQVWTMYNESDHSKGQPGNTGGCFGDHNTEDINTNGVADYQDYAFMTATARDAIHQANPNAQVAFAVAFDDFDTATCPPGYPGLCPSGSHFDYNFLPKLFSYIAANPRPNNAPYADILLFTYYDIYGPFWETRDSGVGWRGIQAKAAAIRGRMNHAGIALPLGVMETGVQSKENWMTQDQQSQCLVHNYVRAIAANLERVTWWTFSDYPNLGFYFGVVDGDFAPKPSYTAYQTLVNEIQGWSFRTIRRNQPTVEAYLFKRDGKRKMVAWSTDATPSNTAPCAYARSEQFLQIKALRARVTDLYGASKIFRDNRKNDFDPREGFMRLRVDSAPRYITLNP